MTRVNQMGDPVRTEILNFSTGDVSREDTQKVIGLMLDHLKLIAVKTNATKRGYTEVQLQPEDWNDGLG